MDRGLRRASASAGARSFPTGPSVDGRTWTRTITCGVVTGGRPDGELVGLSRRLTAWARETASDAIELRRAQARQAMFVDLGVAWIAMSGEGACAATVRSFRDLERERLSARA